MKERGRFDGILQIVRYNARFYAAAPILSAALVWLSRLGRLPRGARVLCMGGAALTAWWTFASLIVSHWVYDRSSLYRWQWISEVLPEPPRHWLNLHCGLDESSASLRALFPHAQSTTLDFFDAEIMSEPSIQIARKHRAALQNFKPHEHETYEHETYELNNLTVDPRDLPCANGSFDTVFLILSAHEIRDADSRLQFFREVARVLADGGRVLLVEHPRDIANLLAFGPGFLHFWSRAVWRNVAQQSGFKIESECPITPFVRVWLLKKR